MGLLDMFKDKAAEFLQGAKDKASDVTGVDLSAGDLTETAAGPIAETGQNIADTATQAGQDLTATADDAIADAKDKLPGT